MMSTIITYNESHLCLSKHSWQCNIFTLTFNSNCHWSILFLNSCCCCFIVFSIYSKRTVFCLTCSWLWAYFAFNLLIFKTKSDNSYNICHLGARNWLNKIQFLFIYTHKTINLKHFLTQFMLVLTQWMFTLAFCLKSLLCSFIVTSSLLIWKNTIK